MTNIGLVAQTQHELTDLAHSKTIITDELGFTGCWTCI